ncbi:MAG TPA: hypothetical protein VKR32_18795 [Puia sp.]|nr:hypothetical protein [Puia sp.]
MKNKAFIYFLVSIAVFWGGAQYAQVAWWGHRPPPILWAFLLATLISFVLAILAILFSIAQIKTKQYNQILNWIVLVGGIIWDLFTGYALWGLAGILFA